MSRFSEYLRRIPPSCHWKLGLELDYDNNLERDLVEIAYYISYWEVKLRVPLQLTPTEVNRIKQESNLDLRQ